MLVLQQPLLTSLTAPHVDSNFHGSFVCTAAPSLSTTALKITFVSKSKMPLKLTIPRIKLIRNRREMQLKQMCKEITKLPKNGQEATAHICELFRSSSGQNIFSIVNGKCVEDPKSKASDVDSESVRRLEVASNQDITGIALANLIRLNWKHASRMNHGLMLTLPLRSIKNDRFGNIDDVMSPLLRPQELRKM